MTGIAGGVSTQADRRGAERRARAISLRYPDRRRGFDRRATSRYQAALGRFRDRPLSIGTILGLIFLLNGADLTLTARALDRGATEANPIMAWAFDQGMLFASSFKLGIGLFIVLSIWHLRRYRLILELSLVLTGLFSLVFAYHLVGSLLV